jgi:hypothetical protein
MILNTGVEERLKSTCLASTKALSSNPVPQKIKESVY